MTTAEADVGTLDLADCRREIDRLDREIVALLSSRARVAQRVGEIKSKTGAAVFVPEREEQVYANVRVANHGPIHPDSLKAIYREILSGMRALEKQLTIAFLGPVHTYTHQAAIARFGQSSHYVPSRTVADVFAATEKGVADFGVVAVENSTGGMVSDTLDLFVTSDLRICAEIMLPIHQALLAQGSTDQIRHIYSHPQALAQCRSWLAANLPTAELIQTTSTVRAAELAANDASAAAIGPEIAAEAHNLRILARHIEDSRANVTRFLVVGRETGHRSGNDKTAVLFSIRDRIGALRDVLDIFERHHINLTKIESRPSRRKIWDYVFFLDLVGHPSDDNVASALEQLRLQCLHVKILGSWPQSDLQESDTGS